MSRGSWRARMVQATDQAETRATAVVKYGSSVLRGPSDVPRVVSDVYRRWRRGERVVCVVSAFRGRTDELLARHDGLAPVTEAPTHALAELAGVGEVEAAAAVAVALERAGLPVRLVRADEVGIVAEGDPTEAEVVGVRPGVVREALDAGAIAVVPGFVARTGDRRSVVLGRGGSDLTAISLADALDVEAVLVKDVGAVCEWDPAELSDGGPSPRRFERLSYAEALALSDRVVQPRAIEHARRLGRGFSSVGVGADRGTAVGAGPTRLGGAWRSERSRPMRVGLLGLGAVGLGVARRLALEPERFELVGALVRDAGRERTGVPEGVPVTDDPGRLLRESPDVVIELIGGVEDARVLTLAALARGAHVVTANKALVALHGDRLHEAAESAGRRIGYSAAVGGVLPVLELVALARSKGRVRSVRGVLNGTTNFVLGAIAKGADLETALREARGLGYAEADATADLSGWDAAAKLSLIGRALGVALDPDAIEREALTAEREVDADVRQVAALDLEYDADGGATARDSARASVRLAPVPRGGRFAGLRGPENAVEIELENGEVLAASAAGAGRWPTTESVFADVDALARDVAGVGADAADRATTYTENAR